MCEGKTCAWKGAHTHSLTEVLLATEWERKWNVCFFGSSLRLDLLFLNFEKTLFAFVFFFRTFYLSILCLIFLFCFFFFFYFFFLLCFNCFPCFSLSLSFLSRRKREETTMDRWYLILEWGHCTTIMCTRALFQFKHLCNLLSLVK